MKLSVYSLNSVKCFMFVFFTYFRGLLYNIVFIFLRFGFVDFESEENCKAVKEAMEDCEIDSSKVTVDFAKSKSGGGHQGSRGGLVGRPARQPAGRGTGRGGHGGRGAKGSRGGNIYCH